MRAPSKARERLKYLFWAALIPRLNRLMRLLNVIDDYSRECIACIVGTSLSGRHVVRELPAIAERRGLPCMVVSDNGTELTRSCCLGLVPGHRRRMALHRAGQATAERLRGIVQWSLTDECLKEHLFPSLAAARRIIKAWRRDYNTVRPHGSLGGMAPAEFTNRAHQEHEDTEANLPAP